LELETGEIHVVEKIPLSDGQMDDHAPTYPQVKKKTISKISVSAWH